MSKYFKIDLSKTKKPLAYLLVAIVISILSFTANFNSHKTEAGLNDWYNLNWQYRKPITVDNSGNASILTNYQVQVTLSVANFDFSKAKTNGEDIRFTDADGTTLIDYWIQSYNAVGQTASIWVEVPSVPALSTKTIYLYYGDTGGSSSASGINTFSFFDDFSYTRDSANSWEKTMGGRAEHQIIKNNKIYTPADGIWIHDLSGNELKHYISGAGQSDCAPVIIGDYIYVWFQASGRLYKVNEATGDSTFTTGNSNDFEHLSTANVGGVDLIFIPKDGLVKAINAADLSVYWSSTVQVTGMWDGGMVVGSYFYARQMAATAKVHKLNLSNGVIVSSSADLGSNGYYAHLTYDADHNQIYVTENTTNKIKALDATNLATQNWERAFSDDVNYFIMYGSNYNNGVVYVSDKTTTGTNRSYLYALNAHDGTVIWKSSEAYNRNVVITNSIISDNYIFAPTNDYLDRNYNKMMVLKVSDGTLYQEIWQTSDSACSSPAISNGMIYLGMWEDNRINARDLGVGEQLDSGFKIDSNLTGYVGNRLTSYSPQEQSPTWISKWDLGNGFTMNGTKLNGNGAAGTTWKRINTASGLSGNSYIFESDINVNSSLSAGYTSGPIIAKDSGNEYAIIIDPTANVMAIYKFSNPNMGGGSIVATNNTFAIDMGVNYRFRVKVRSAGILIDFYDTSWHNSVLTYAMTPVTGHKLGGSLYQTNVNFDNFLVRQYTTPEPSTTLGVEEPLSGTGITVTLSAPADGATVATTTPTLTWGSNVAGKAGLAGYQLYIDGALNKTVAAGTTSTTPTAALSEAAHTWYVRAINENTENLAQSLTWNMTVDLPYPPNAPTLSVPINGTTGASVTPTFQLSATDPDGSALKYKIQIAKNVGFTLGLETFDQAISGTGWDNGTSSYISGVTAFYSLSIALDYGSEYFWRGYAIDPLDTNTWSSASSTFSFTTITAPLIDNTNPTLDIVYPFGANWWTYGYIIPIRGFVSDSESGVAMVSIYNMQTENTDNVSTINSDGYFEQWIDLERTAKNIVQIKARDNSGNIATEERTIYQIPHGLAKYLPSSIASKEEGRSLLEKLGVKAVVFISIYDSEIDKWVEMSEQSEPIVYTRTPKFKGTTIPEGKVDLYINSEEIHAVTLADSNGNWQYQLTEPLEYGQHFIYATVTDNNDNVSQATNKFAFTVKDPSEMPLATKVSKNMREFQIWWVFAGAALILLIILGYFLLRTKKKYN